ncbi:OprO/OprP family phosphate-selective porin [Pseudoxanthomonas beigongshangi]
MNTKLMPPLLVTTCLSLCTPAWAQSGVGAGDAQVTAIEQIVRQQATHIRMLEARLADIEFRLAETPVHAAVEPMQAMEADALASRLDRLEAASSTQPKISMVKGAPEFTLADGKARFRPRGRFFADASSTGGSDAASRNLSGTEISSARLGAEGNYGRLGYVLEADFAGDAVSWKSAYGAFEHRLFGIPAEFSIGLRLNDRSMDGASGVSNTPFQSRNVVGAVIIPQHGASDLGVMQRLQGEDWHVALHVSGDAPDEPGSGNGALAYTLRGHWNPVRTERMTVHLGGWGFREQIRGAARVVRGAAIGGTFNDNLRIAPGRVADADRSEALGLELAMFAGPAWVQGEWGARRARGWEDGARGMFTHRAHALAAGWFLGEARPAYSARTGTWGRVKVGTPVSDGGPGAWELKARYDAVDYTDLPGGGRGSAWTAGINWYLNDWSRVMLDTVRWRSENRSGAWPGLDRGYTVNLRFQLAF